MRDKVQIEIITYKKDRINYFTSLMRGAERRQKRLERKYKDAIWYSEEWLQLYEAIREAQFLQDVVKLLEKDYSDPTEDIEVVKCEECRYWSPTDNGFSFHNIGRTDGACDMLCRLHYAERHLTRHDHFCSYGKKKI